MSQTDVNSPDFWEGAYQNLDAPWDLSGPTPVFAALLESGRFKPGRLIVLGAGRGHDARLFARAGFDVTAVDFAAQAVADMRALAEADAPVDVQQADIFALPAALSGQFDYVLEYTCFCAIDPQRHAEYADAVAGLLRPGGTYIALAFPIEARTSGPPFGVSPDELESLFTTRGLALLERGPSPHTIKPRRGREELMIFVKGET
ncbi:MAG: methyltransferase domain-containing protein [Anaerolineales bacterium]